VKNLLSITIAAALLGPAVHAQDPSDTAKSRAAKTVVTLAVEAGSFQTLVAAVKAAGLFDTLNGKGPFTVFAPTDDAFARLGKKKIDELLLPENRDMLRSILTYHVLAGEFPAAKVMTMTELATVQGAALPVKMNKEHVWVGGAKVAATDIFGSNGVIHVIDAVMLPPEGPGNLVAVAAKAGSFQTLLKAAAAAGLADTLANGGPFTVFAPTDAAFAKLGKDTIADLLKPENKEKLAGILKYHIVSGKVMAADVVGLKSARTLQGGSVQIAVDEGKVMINGAQVVQTDVSARNGVIHVIDAVILPQ
jgi:transforming growth factor-beta-induced protein